ncbi:hypothetical protein [Pseudomarimonas salicorniae]|uniref:Uncharacterized protein n=1 Tax=Pseudomarimonas salicorniae TaxID=2933270 RepID=A0ABT0GD59_9GAMM|nr:hypothetical protein [Lysobacter sp. CAU 1642]MCK7592479.1 hypothetical protein [Lysobacter sp. CAU 1642]
MNAHDKRPRDDRWLLRSRELLNRQAEEADPALQRRLQQMRREALAPLRAPRRGWAIGMTLAGASAALLIAVGVMRFIAPASMAPADGPLPDSGTALRAESPIEQALTLPEEDLALIAGDVDYTLVEELEFYAWLEQQDLGS